MKTKCTVWYVPKREVSFAPEGEDVGHGSSWTARDDDHAYGVVGLEVEHVGQAKGHSRHYQELG